mmetsp:Transcript_9070/g.37305  ORF Transcript_9070/g.37305 Transcript_9070/m.37305 type:complete len:642 (-) Transcript_9070:2572-4497(-)
MSQVSPTSVGYTMARERESARISWQHAFGVAATCKDVEFVSIEDESGVSKDHVIHSVGQHISISRLDDNSMKLLTAECQEVREITAFCVAPSKRTVAVSEMWKVMCKSPSRSGCALQGRCSADRPAEDGPRARNEFILIDRSTDSHGSYLSLYHLSSGHRLHAPTPTGYVFIDKIAFLQEGKRVVGIGRTDLSDCTQSLTVWNLETGTNEAAASISSTLSCAAGFLPNPRKQCILTSGLEHVKLWELADNSLRMQALLPPTVETGAHFVAQKLARLSASLYSQSLPKRDCAVDALSHSCVHTPCHLLLLNVRAQQTGSCRWEIHSHSAHDRTTTPAPCVLVLRRIKQLPYFEMHLRLPVQVPHSVSLMCLAVHSHGFCVAGTCGYIAIFERQDDIKCPYIQQYSCCVDLSRTPGESPLTWINLAVNSNSDTLLAFADNHTLHSFPLTEFPVLGADRCLGDLFTPLLSQGFGHFGPIYSMDAALHRPLIATCGADNTIRLFNYKRRKCEILHRYQSASENGSAKGIAVHPFGFHVLIAFEERLCLYSILFKSLKFLHHIVIKCCQVTYANGGHRFACASGVNVVVFSTVSMLPLQTFTGHLLHVRCVVWADDDFSVFAVSDDGQVCGWDFVTSGRIDTPPPC